MLEFESFKAAGSECSGEGVISFWGFVSAGNGTHFASPFVIFEIQSHSLEIRVYISKKIQIYQNKKDI